MVDIFPFCNNRHSWLTFFHFVAQALKQTLCPFRGFSLLWPFFFSFCGASHKHFSIFWDQPFMADNFPFFGTSPLWPKLFHFVGQALYWPTIFHFLGSFLGPALYGQNISILWNQLFMADDFPYCGTSPLWPPLFNFVGSALYGQHFSILWDQPFMADTFSLSNNYTLKMRWVPTLIIFIVSYS